MKKLLVVIVVLVAILGAAGAWFSSYVSETVTRRVPAVMSAVAGVPVGIGSFELDLLGAGAVLRGLEIGNAEGFPSPNAFSLDEVAISIDLGSLVAAARGSGPIGIRTLAINAPAVFVDVDEDDHTNLEAILRGMPGDAASGDGSGDSNTTAGGEDAPDGGSTEGGGASEGDAGDGTPRHRIRVDELVMTDVTFAVARTGDPQRSGSLDEIRISDVGGDTGVTAVGLAAIVVSRLARETLEEAVQLVIEKKAEEAIDDAADKLLDKLRRKLGN